MRQTTALVEWFAANVVKAKCGLLHIGQLQAYYLSFNDLFELSESVIDLHLPSCRCEDQTNIKARQCNLHSI